MCCAEGASLIVLKWGGFPLCAAPKTQPLDLKLETYRYVMW